MARRKVAHAKLKGPRVFEGICLGISLGLTCASMWKKKQREEQRKTRTLYDLLEKGEISITSEE